MMTGTRRGFLQLLAGAASIPLVGRLPAVKQMSAWATVTIEAGQIVGIHIVSAGMGYTHPPTITIDGDDIRIAPPC